MENRFSVYRTAFRIPKKLFPWGISYRFYQSDHKENFAKSSGDGVGLTIQSRAVGRGQLHAVRERSSGTSIPFALIQTVNKMNSARSSPNGQARDRRRDIRRQ